MTAATDERAEFVRLAGEVEAQAQALRGRWEAQGAPPESLAPATTAIDQARMWREVVERGQWPEPGVRLGLAAAYSQVDLGDEGEALGDAIHALEQHWIRVGGSRRSEGA